MIISETTDIVSQLLVDSRWKENMCLQLFSGGKVANLGFANGIASRPSAAIETIEHIKIYKIITIKLNSVWPFL
jgi:hypothetical protein